MGYDGTGKLGDAMAVLYGISPKDGKRLDELVKQAKAKLMIVCKSQNLPNDMKLAIYRWHHERQNHVLPVKQGDGDTLAKPIDAQQASVSVSFAMINALYGGDPVIFTIRHPKATARPQEPST